MKKGKNIVLIPVINRFNYPFYYLASFFCRLKALEMLDGIAANGRVERIRLTDYMTSDEVVIIADEAAAYADRIVCAIDSLQWQTLIDGMSVDFKLRIRQTLYREISRYSTLDKVYERVKCEKKRVLYSAAIYFLENNSGGKKLFKCLSKTFASYANIFIDLMGDSLANLICGARTILGLVSGIFSRGKLMEKAIIYDGDNTLDITSDRKKMSSIWILDGQLIRNKDVVFVLPNIALEKMTKAESLLRQDSIDYIWRDNISKHAKVEYILKALVETVKFMVLQTALCLSFGHIQRIRLSIDTLRWVPFIKTVKPKVYIYTFSNAGIENPAIAYFKRASIKTVGWLSSASTGRYLIKQYSAPCLFRRCKFANTQMDILAVWNKNYADYILSHHQEGLKINVTGPIMNGDETVFAMSKKEMCIAYGIPYNEKLRYFVVFDIRVLFPKKFIDPHIMLSEEHLVRYLSDCYKLLDDISDTKLVVKPKKFRDVKDFFYSDKVKEMYKRWESDDRVHFLEFDINPWVPIALADLCVNIPFGSPNVAAIHYGKPIIYYDPCKEAAVPRRDMKD